MEKYIGKVAIVTGASAGIGAAIAKELAINGMIVVGLARRKDLVNKLNDELPQKSKGKIYGLTCDVSQQEQIINAFSIVELNFGGCDVLINNAGILKEAMILEEGNSDILTKTIATNLTGLILCSKEAVSSMRKRNVNDGHIIHIGSVAGHTVPVLPFVKPTMNVYSSTKFGVKAVTETMRQELIYMKSKIKVSVISPGMVKTEIFDESVQAGFPVDLPVMEPKDIADAVVYILGTPKNVQIHDIIMKPMGEMF